jgi:excisionase family DNA binding protein
MEKQADPMPSFVTLQQAARLLNLPGDRILKMIHSKELPG